MQKRIVCENLRSAYNVGNIIRTADGLWRGVILVWYTAPKEHKKVSKTALWAEEHVAMMSFEGLELFYNWVQTEKLCLLAAEKTETSIALGSQDFSDAMKWCNGHAGFALVMGNEITWVEQTTLHLSDYIVHIPMLGLKESFNVGQAAAILMWEMSKSN